MAESRHARARLTRIVPKRRRLLGENMGFCWEFVSALKLQLEKAHGPHCYDEGPVV